MVSSEAMRSNVEPKPLIGIFAGGAGRRMGGIDKGGLKVPGSSESILEHHAGLAFKLHLPCVLLGARPAWQLQLPQCSTLADNPSGVGPLGGLHALLRAAQGTTAIALACDMPYINLEVLTLLCEQPKGPAIVAPKDPSTGKWQPLFARYEADQVLPALRNALDAGQHSFQTLFASIDVQELTLPSALHARLRDWDRPEDMQGDTRKHKP